jgi:hypothetical protein
MKNKWFKHYNTASQGQTLRLLWDSGKTDTIAFYWLILELVSRWEDENSRGRLEINMGVLMRETGWKRDKIERELTRLRSDSCSITIPDRPHDRTTIVTIVIDKWLELQETRGGKTRAKTEQKPDRRKTLEVRSNIQKENTTKNSVCFDVDKIYQEYPSRAGNTNKALGLQRLIKMINNDDVFNLVLKAVKNYKRHCEQEKIIGTKFVMQFSTFFGNEKDWHEWIDYKNSSDDKAERNKKLLSEFGFST